MNQRQECLVQLDFVFALRIEVGPVEPLGSSWRGERRRVSILGGSILGDRLNGRVLAGGADWQTLRPDAVLEVDARYEIQADDGTKISIRNRGIRHGPAEVMARLAAGELVDPDQYYFRTVPIFETPPGTHDWLMRSVFVARGTREANHVQISVWKVK